MGKIFCYLSLIVGMSSCMSLMAQPQGQGAKAPAKGVRNAQDFGALTFPEMEELFLTGKISARQFQYYISRVPTQQKITAKAPVKKEPVKMAPEKEKEAVEVLRLTKPDPSKNPPPGPAIKPEQLPILANEDIQPETSIEKDFSGIEGKMEELLLLKKEREKRLQETISKASDSPPGNGSNKRERLDGLLRLYIHGKISQTEYNEKRKAIIAERQANPSPDKLD
jgi:hypothetical protein